MDFSFFITNNKSGYKTSEKWLLKNHFDEYNKIINYSIDIKLDLSFKEKIWFYYNGLTERPKCKTCGEDLKFRERFDKPYGEFCSLFCINNNKQEMIIRQNKTFQKKYGIDFYPQHSDFVNKQKLTKKIRYGDENYNNLEKSRKTKKDKYNDQNYNNIEKYKLTCLNKYETNNYSKSNNYQNRVKENFKKLYPDINFNDINKNIVTIICNKCGKSYEISKQLLYERYKRNYDICVHCNPIGQSFRSGYEKEITNFLDLFNINYKCSSKEILGNNQELDIFISDHNIAIEMDGVYWHNELFVPPDYHLKKTINCQEKNIELIHIFEDEWVNKKEIVKSIIKNKLGKTDNLIYARKCVIKEIDSNTCKNFLNDNHIQGNVNSKVRIGLFYNNELISVMTFSKGRIVMGGKPNEWELTRFSNKINTNVIGGASRLLNNFIKNYLPDKIISYSDIRIFNGNMYETLGFVKKSQSKPNYWYVINGNRYHRFNFRKSVLIKEGYDINKTEREIMFDRKIYRIYDCGHIRWEYN